MRMAESAGLVGFLLCRPVLRGVCTSAFVLDSDMGPSERKISWVLPKKRTCYICVYTRRGGSGATELTAMTQD